MPAAQAMLEMRAAPAAPEAARDALSDAAASLLAPAAGGAQGERERARAASRVTEACVAARRLEQSLAAEAPRDLKDSLRQLDRDARFAVRALPPALKEICADPSRSSEPGNLSALERVRSIDLDRARIVAMQSVIDGIGAVKPGAGRAFATQAKRMARLLTDPLKREQGQAAFATLEALHGAAFPFPYEDELKRRTPRAVELAGGAPEKVIEPYPRRFSVRLVAPVCKLRKLPTVSNAPLSIELFRVQSPLIAPAIAVPPATEVPVRVIGLAPEKRPVLPAAIVTSVPIVKGPPYPKIPPPLPVKVVLLKVRPPGPTALEFNPSIPAPTESAPVNVLAADGASTHKPASSFVTERMFAALLARVPEIKFMSALSPRSVSVFAPAPELDTVES
jgi:hypothetical protein